MRSRWLAFVAITVLLAYGCAHSASEPDDTPGPRDATTDPGAIDSTVPGDGADDGASDEPADDDTGSPPGVDAGGKDAKTPDAPSEAAPDAPADAPLDVTPADAHDASDANDANDAGGHTTIVVVRVGTGGAALTIGSTAVFLDEVRLSDGAVVRTIPMPVAASGQNQPFSMTGTAVTEGTLSTSDDGRYLALTGYAAAPGAIASLPGTTASAVPRIVARVDSAGNVDTTTTLGNFFSTNNVRAAYTPDGTRFWVSGYDTNGGVVYTTIGPNAPVQIVSAPASGHVVAAFGGQLFASGGSAPLEGVLGIGAGLPTTPGTPTALLANTLSASSYGFAVLDRNPAVAGLDTIYLGDRGAIASGGGLQKWTFNGTAWSLAATFASGITSGVGQLAADVTAAGVVLYATTAENPTRLGAFLDDGVNANPAFSPIASAPTNTVFHGVAFPPR